MRIYFSILLIACATTPCLSQAGDHAKKAVEFLATLDQKQKAKVIYAYDDPERLNWWFVPRDRNGLTFHAMNDQQRDAAIALIKASLSPEGFKKASGIMSLEPILKQLESRAADDGYRDPKKYYFTIFGNPSDGKVWGWRIEGHHLSLNFTSSKGVIASSTPSFMGSNPAIVPSGPDKGKTVLKEEIDLAFALLNSLTDDQLKQVRISETALPEIVTGNKRKAELLEPKGIPFTALNADQQKQFLKLLDVYVKNYELGFAATLMNKIRKSGIDNLSFAWAGSLTPGAGHYYRIQGPMLLIEYDNTQNNANHVHTAVRDLTNDFAEDILHEHYQKEHQH